jgi:hypothetical protein
VGTDDHEGSTAAEGRRLAMAWLASGDAPPAPLAAAVDALRAAGWTTATALAAVRRNAPALRVVSDSEATARGPDSAPRLAAAS